MGTGKDEESGMDWESSTDIHARPCGKQAVSGKLPHSAETSSL